jgi:serine/threonine protein kinase/Tfp pilus assembly protein PilF
MPLLEKELIRCEQCGTMLESVTAASGCLNCLLGGGLNEPGTISRRFQHYEVCVREDGITLDELGRGAMGITYRALDLNLDSPAALKVISAAYSDKLEARARFRREARAAAQLRHPNVASVFHFGEMPGGECFYAMELIEGETFETRVRRDGPLNVSSALDVAEQVCRALIAAESHGLVHRDLKPSNLMIVPHELSGTDSLLVKVIDFGLAKAVVALEDHASHPGFSGTPEFASPEQFDSSKASLDARSDIYSLGATLWYLLCSKAPFSGDIVSLRDHQRRLPLEDLTAANVPTPLASLLRSMLATDPDARPRSACELLHALRVCRKAIEAKPRRLRNFALGASMVALLSVIALASYLWRPQQTQGPALPELPAPEKSIAVLPFDNLGADKENAYFASGVQDEILSNLAKIAELKVISRTSVSQYQSGAPRNLREIGRALGVTHVLEGSVQRVANRARVNAQLIDTRTDAHLWAETYDRELADVFAIQTEIAQKIATQLQARISPGEQAAIERRPTKDIMAYNLYVEAKSLIDKAIHMEGKEMTDAYARAIALLNQAIERDSGFVLAYCRLAEAHDGAYFKGVDHTPKRLDLAKSAIDSAFRLQPNSGEVHLALAIHLYNGYFDYDRARDELDIAARTLPNDSRIFEWSGYIDRRQNRWHDAIRNFNHAVDLDPQNPKLLTAAKITYWLMRDLKNARELHDRVVALNPKADLQMERAWREVIERGDTRALHVVLKTKSPDDPEYLDTFFQLALWDRDATEAERMLRAVVARYGDDFQPRGSAAFNRDYWKGLIARIRGDDAGARAAFTAARAKQEEILRTVPHFDPALCVLGLIDAALGRKEEALREGWHAVELARPEKEALDAADVLYYYAVICAWVGERDLAIERLETSAKMPGGVSYMEIRLDPHWDPLRSDPRFEKIVASLVPKG